MQSSGITWKDSSILNFLNTNLNDDLHTNNEDIDPYNVLDVQQADEASFDVNTDSVLVKVEDDHFEDEEIEER